MIRIFSLNSRLFRPLAAAWSVLLAFLFPQLLAARHHMHDGLARKTPKGPKLRRLLERHGRNKVELLKSFSAPTVVLKTAGSTGRPLQQG